MSLFLGAPSTSSAPAAAIIGFGSHPFVYQGGREGDSPVVGFSPRKAATVLYPALGRGDSEALPERLGKHPGERLPLRQEACGGGPQVLE